MKRCLVWMRQNPPFPCHFECGRRLLTKFAPAEFNGWEWFTGYGDGPIHFCPQCRRTRQFDIDLIRKAANIRPHNYPEQRHELANFRATPPTDKPGGGRG